MEVAWGRRDMRQAYQGKCHASLAFRLRSGRSRRLGWLPPRMPGERLVTFLVSFMYVYLPPSPSTTAL